MGILWLFVAIVDGYSIGSLSGLVGLAVVGSGGCSNNSCSQNFKLVGVARKKFQGLPRTGSDRVGFLQQYEPKAETWVLKQDMWAASTKFQH